MNKTSESREIFSKKIASYKLDINREIEKYCSAALSQTHENFGEYPSLAVQAYCEILKRGGKRMRGILSVIAYEMTGGQDKKVALKTALAVEMLHAYILMIDDIQDRSEKRRGGPTGHVSLAQYHDSKHLKGSSKHFGESIALNGALFGLHSALNVLVDIDVDSNYKVLAIKNVNKNFIITAHGQTMDIFAEALQVSSETDADKILLWKTSFYTFLNPLQLGAIMAGSTEDDLRKFENFSIHAGRAFQITDDILGVFGDEKIIGKDPMDDMREGKRTILIVKTLELAPKADAYFLEQRLGDNNLTQAEFEKCREIIESSGALAYAQRQAKNYVIDALAALENIKKSSGKDEVNFLAYLIRSLPTRKS